MPTRQEQLLDAAIGILGTQGIRALTHRAVDAAAALPTGSAANYFKTRDALISAVVDRFVERDRVAWETIAGFVRPTTPAELAAALVAYVHRVLGPERAVTLARYGLFVEAALHPELQAGLAEAAATIRGWGTHWLRAAGSADPERDSAAILDYLDGVILHQLTYPKPIEQLEDAVTRTVRSLCTLG
ncbi:TetR/AcrR family transcriptional regulator [Actinoplanes sp. DH11]|uniref:TetR/AcrR family transcriptional regulator n=1 Tax=Actinoplanes sp. DH11 TaxID=2857011 RepID=UPI001E634182|nr:TetR family transcriptional regulator [Actinoplanes sp. DH11]